MKKIGKLLLFIICALLIFNPYYVGATEESGTVGEGETTGGETVEPTPEPTEIYEIKLDNSELSLDAGKTTTLKATVIPEGAKVIWSSSDESIAKVDDNGKVTAGNSAGRAIITAKIDGTDKEATCTVSVTRNQGTDATLKSLIISNGTLDKEFKSDMYEYIVTIAPYVSELELDYVLSDERAEVGFVNGNDALEDGDTVTILINAENHTADSPNQKTYKLKIVKEELSLNLKKLGLNGYALNEIFDPDTQTYTANIPYEVEIVTVDAIPEADGVNVTISGNSNLIVGQNVVKIEVKDANGNSKVYKIVVIRDKETSVEENPTSIITSGMFADGDNNSNDDKKTNDSSDNEVLKYVIVSFASLILFAIGGIGIYFYIKTSPKKLRKEILEAKNKENISPVVEVNENQEIVDTNEQTDSVELSSNIGSMMETKLVETREFQMDELNDTKLENLFDDGEDV